MCFSLKKVDRRSAIIHVFTKTPPTQGSRKVVRFMQNEPQFISYRAQRTNVNMQTCIQRSTTGNCKSGLCGQVAFVRSYLSVISYISHSLMLYSFKLCCKWCLNVRLIPVCIFVCDKKDLILILINNTLMLVRPLDI